MTTERQKAKNLKLLRTQYGFDLPALMEDAEAGRREGSQAEERQEMRSSPPTACPSVPIEGSIWPQNRRTAVDGYHGRVC